MKELRTYNSVFRIEKTIYAIEDFQLPVPVTYRQLAFFGGTLVMMIILSRLPVTGWVLNYAPIISTEIIKYGLIPVASAWFFTKKLMDGKRPHRFLWCYFQHRLLSPHRFSRYRELEVPRKGWRYEGAVGYRLYDGGDQE